MSPAPGIQVESVSHTYERWDHRVDALSNLNLTVAAGEWLMVVGPNGSGKSTLLKLLAGQLAIQAGKVSVFGADISATPRRDLCRLVYLVHQDPTVGTAPTLTVAEHLMLAAPRESRGAQLLETVRLDASLNQPVNTLSGGQRQLLCLLIAMLRPGPLVLLDEPLAALDSARAERCDRALDLLQERGKTLVLVTHDIVYARSRGDRMIALAEGRLVSDKRGPSREHGTTVLSGTAGCHA